MVISKVSAITAVLSLFLLSTNEAQAQPVAWTNDCVVGDVATIRGISCLVSNLLSVSLSLLGLLFFIMLLVGGFKYLTSGGDPKGVEGAKSTITSALAAIFLVIVSWFGLRLIAEITGVDILRLSFPLPN
jgi:hypothetical protein